MRKILIITLIILCVAMLSIPAMAAGTATLSASNAWVNPGSTFRIVVDVSGAGSYRRGGIEVSCDSKFELLEGKWNIAGTTFTEFNTGDKTGTFVLGEAKSITGNVFEMTFRVKDNAAFQAGNISVKLTLGLTGQGEEMSNTIKINVICPHNYGAWTSNGTSGHSRTCSICYYVESAYHGFDNECDTTCDACGYTREITHQFGEEWISDEIGHWHECAICATRSDEAEHIPGDAASEYTDQSCTVCGYILSTALGHTHRYEDAYVSDDNGHWKECSGELSSGDRCGEPTESQPHVFDGDCDDTCDECGYQRQITHKHGDWEQDATSHWKTCTECGTEELKGDHSWDVEFVKVKVEPTYDQPGVRVYRCKDCMAEREEPIPQLEGSAISAPFGLVWWLWLAIGAAGGILLTAIVYTLIIVIGVNKKRGGRFSGR